MDFTVPADRRTKIKESEKRDKFLDLVRELKKVFEHEDGSDTNCCYSTWNNPQRINEGTGRLRNLKASGDHSNYNIVEIGQNTEKSPGDLRRLAVTQTSVKDY